MRSRTPRRTRPRPCPATAAACVPRARATAAAPRPPPSPAPGRACTRPVPAGHGRPGATRAGTQPRRTPGRRGRPVAASPATGMRTAGASRAHGDEPPARVDDAAPAELPRQPLRAEVALVDLPARAVLEHALLHLDRLVFRPNLRVDHHELPGHPPRLFEE